MSAVDDARQALRTQEMEAVLRQAAAQFVAEPPQLLTLIASDVREWVDSVMAEQAAEINELRSTIAFNRDATHREHRAMAQAHYLEVMRLTRRERVLATALDQLRAQSSPSQRAALTRLDRHIERLMAELLEAEANR